jgi:hypothetical protein
MKDEELKEAFTQIIEAMEADTADASAVEAEVAKLVTLLDNESKTIESQQ